MSIGDIQCVTLKLFTRLSTRIRIARNDISSYDGHYIPLRMLSKVNFTAGFINLHLRFILRCCYVKRQRFAPFCRFRWMTQTRRKLAIAISSSSYTTLTYRFTLYDYKALVVSKKDTGAAATADRMIDIC